MKTATAYAIYNANTEIQRGPAFESETEAQAEANALSAAPNLPDTYLVKVVELQKTDKLKGTEIMKTVMVTKTVGRDSEGDKRYVVKFPGNESCKRRNLVVCRTKAAAARVMEALASPEVLWPVD